MKKLALALSVAFLTLAASSAQAIELTDLKNGTPVAKLSAEFKRDFVHLKDGLFVGESTLDGVRFVTFVKADWDGEINAVLAEHVGADESSYEALLPSALKLFSADLTAYETDDCSADAGGLKRAKGVYSAPDNLQMFAHVWVSGKSQTLRLALGTSLLSTGEPVLNLLSKHSGPRVRELSRYLEKRAATSVPKFTPACSNQVRESLPTPSFGAFTDAEIGGLGPATPRTGSDGNGTIGWDYLFAGVLGRLKHTPSTGEFGARWTWSTRAISEPTSADVERSLEILSRELGVPTTIDKIRWPKGGITHLGWTTNHEHITASGGQNPDGTRFIGILRQSSLARAPEKTTGAGAQGK